MAGTDIFIVPSFPTLGPGPSQFIPYIQFFFFFFWKLIISLHTYQCSQVYCIRYIVRYPWIVVITIISLLSLSFLSIVYKKQQIGKAAEFIHSGPLFSSKMPQLSVKDKAENPMKNNFRVYLKIHWFIFLSFCQQGKSKLCLTKQEKYTALKKYILIKKK